MGEVASRRTSEEEQELAVEKWGERLPGRRRSICQDREEHRELREVHCGKKGGSGWCKKANPEGNPL